MLSNDFYHLKNEFARTSRDCGWTSAISIQYLQNHPYNFILLKSIDINLLYHANVFHYFQFA